MVLTPSELVVPMEFAFSGPQSVTAGCGSLLSSYVVFEIGLSGRGLTADFLSWNLLVFRQLRVIKNPASFWGAGFT